MLTRSESRVDALTKHMETQDEQMRQELVICKAIVLARVMATHEGSKDNHTMSGEEEVIPSIARYGEGKVPYNRDKGKGNDK